MNMNVVDMIILLFLMDKNHIPWLTEYLYKKIMSLLIHTPTLNVQIMFSGPFKATLIIDDISKIQVK